MKVPPHNLDAESSVLGACLISPDACHIAVDKLTPTDYYHGAHGTVFGAIQQLASEGKPVDMITVTQTLSASGTLQQIGGASYVASLANSVPTAASVEHYAGIVADLATRRRIIQAAIAVATKGYDMDVSDYRSYAETEILAATGETSTEGPVSIGSILRGGTLTEILNPKEDSGIKSPWPELNELMPSMEPGDMITIAARPSMGKTAFGLQLAEHAAKNGPAIFFSLEMSNKQLTMRLLSNRASVSGYLLRTGKLNELERERIYKAGAQYYKQPIYLDDTAGLTMSQIRSRAQRIKAREGLSMVLIDYLGYVKASGENRTQEVSKISRGIKEMAKGLKVPVIALAQLNRSVEQREDKHPRLSDLRESGSIEQDSDVVMFLYRDDYYNADSPKKGISEVIISKQRNGPTGMVELAWLKEYTRFMSLTRSG